MSHWLGLRYPPSSKHSTPVGSLLGSQTQAALTLLEPERPQLALLRATECYCSEESERRPWGQFTVGKAPKLQLPELPKREELRAKHGARARLPAPDPSFSINTIKLAPYAVLQLCLSQGIQISLQYKDFSFLCSNTAFSDILWCQAKLSCINPVLKWLTLMRNYLTCTDDTHLNSQAPSSHYFTSSVFSFPWFLHLSQDSSKFSN